MYVAVKGGERAIANAHLLLADRRRGEQSLPVLSIAQVVQQLSIGAARVMAEGSLYDHELAALAIIQGRGDTLEAISLVRSYRATLTRFGYSVPVDTGRMRPDRRVSATFKDLPWVALRGDLSNCAQPHCLILAVWSELPVLVLVAGGSAPSPLGDQPEGEELHDYIV